jgi:Bifunctional DNA primase/polymerase, N-terminal
LPQLKQWSDKMPNANLGLLGRDNQPGDIVFLEFNQGTLAEAAAEMGQPIPETRIHISGGKGLEHCAFKQTERSLNLGNRSANRNGREWFSLRMHHRYVLGPGSIHPDTGKPYTVRNDIPPTDFPNWLVEWINKYTVSEFDAAGGKDMPEVSEDFDFDSFREYLPFSLTQDGYWYIVSECRGVGRKHEHSKKTGIFWDGTKLGWKCFAQFCPWAYRDSGAKFTIGDVIHALAEEIGAYDGSIWPESPIEDELEEMGVEIVTDAHDVMPELPVNGNGNNNGCIPAILQPTPAVEVMEDKPITAASAIPPFPEDCLCGKLGEYARMIEMPLASPILRSSGATA